MIDPKTPTSFIPKGPSIQNTRTGGSFAPNLFSIIAIILFLASIGFAVGVWTWNKNLKAQIVDAEEELNRNRAQFGSDIETLKKFNAKIAAIKDLLSNHTRVSGVFDIIAELAIDKVRFTSVDISSGDASVGGGSVIVTIKGEGLGLTSAAAQADALGLKEWRLRNPVMADLGITELKDEANTLAPINSTEKVTFTLSGIIPRSELSFMNYKNTKNATSSILNNTNTTNGTSTANGTSTNKTVDDNNGTSTKK